jgi:hypothetical protein
VGLISTAKKAGVAAGGVVAAYKATVTVSGQPVRKRLEPAAITIAGIPVFERDESLERTWFGFIKRGRSKVAREHLAATERREGGGDGR